MTKKVILFLVEGVSFYGKSHTKENAHELFAVVVDVDYRPALLPMKNAPMTVAMNGWS